MGQSWTAQAAVSRKGEEGKTMPTERKVQTVEELEEKFKRCSIAIATEFRGVTVGQMQDLRKQLRLQGIEYQVTKITLSGIAGENAGKGGIKQVMHGPTAIAFGYGD